MCFQQNTLFDNDTFLFRLLFNVSDKHVSGYATECKVKPNHVCLNDGVGAYPAHVSSTYSYLAVGRSSSVYREDTGLFIATGALGLTQHVSTDTLYSVPAFAVVLSLLTCLVEGTQTRLTANMMENPLSQPTSTRLSQPQTPHCHNHKHRILSTTNTPLSQPHKLLFHNHKDPIVTTTSTIFAQPKTPYSHKHPTVTTTL